MKFFNILKSNGLWKLRFHSIINCSLQILSSSSADPFSETETALSTKQHGHFCCQDHCHSLLRLMYIWDKSPVAPWTMESCSTTSWTSSCPCAPHPSTPCTSCPCTASSRSNRLWTRPFSASTRWPQHLSSKFREQSTRIKCLRCRFKWEFRIF